MFSFCGNCFGEVLIQLYGHSMGCSLWCCWTVLRYSDKCFYYFVHSIYISEGKPLQLSVSTKTEHYNLHEGRIYCRAVILDCISSSKVHLQNWQPSVIISLNHRLLCLKQNLINSTWKLRFINSHPLQWQEIKEKTRKDGRTSSCCRQLQLSELKLF